MDTTQVATAEEANERRLKMAGYEAWLDGQERERRSIADEVEARVMARLSGQFAGNAMGTTTEVTRDRGSVEAWLRDRLTDVIQALPLKDRSKYAEGGQRVEAWSIDSTSDDAWQVSHEITDLRAVDVRFSESTSGVWDGFLLTQREGVYWSGEYYARNQFERYGLALDEGDVRMLVDHYVAPYEAQYADETGNTGHVCYPRV